MPNLKLSEILEREEMESADEYFEYILALHNNGQNSSADATYREMKHENKNQMLMIIRHESAYYHFISL